MIFITVWSAVSSHLRYQYKQRFVKDLVPPSSLNRVSNFDTLPKVFEKVFIKEEYSFAIDFLPSSIRHELEFYQTNSTYYDVITKLIYEENYSVSRSAELRKKFLNQPCSILWTLLVDASHLKQDRQFESLLTLVKNKAEAFQTPLGVIARRGAIPHKIWDKMMENSQRAIESGLDVFMFRKYGMVERPTMNKQKSLFALPVVLIVEIFILWGILIAFSTGVLAAELLTARKQPQDTGNRICQ